MSLASYRAALPGEEEGEVELMEKEEQKMFLLPLLDNIFKIITYLSNAVSNDYYS